MTKVPTQKGRTPPDTSCMFGHSEDNNLTKGPATVDKILVTDASRMGINGRDCPGQREGADESHPTSHHHYNIRPFVLRKGN